jgi:oligoribonuclease
MANGGPLVWIDCEMTGLDLERDALVEIAAVVTDAELTVLGEGVDVVIRPPDHTVEQMVDVVREMHTASGLLDELPHGVTLAPLAGSSVYTDRAFISRDLPTLDAHLHYRLVDVSTVKELARRWYPRAYFNSPEKRGGHRALADILESIDELRYYREAVFVPRPGPDTPTSRAIAARYGQPPLGAEGTQPG